jgi:LacI family transcriptional regulator
MEHPTAARKGTKARSVTKDVARLAGVSTATVSRVLNNSLQVDPETRQKVLDAAAKLRYVPHGPARSLRSHRSKMVGAIVPSFDYALYARTTSALQQRLDESGYALVVAEHHYDLAAETRIASEMVGHGVDAFVLVGLDHQQGLFAMLEDFDRPYVLSWGVDSAQRHPSIGFDNRAATFQVTRHLIALGHRRIGLLSAPVADNDRARARGEGLRAALSEAGLELDSRHIAYAPISLATAEAAMHKLLGVSPRPTAIVATNDVFAVGAMMACRQAGVNIPLELSITGVDNTDLGATQTPGLTSVATPIREIGRAAGEQLVARLEGRGWEAFQTFPVEIVFRGSTSRPAQPEEVSSP